MAFGCGFAVEFDIQIRLIGLAASERSLFSMAWCGQVSYYHSLAFCCLSTRTYTIGNFRAVLSSAISPSQESDPKIQNHE
jgi:hypothetical protein